MNLLQEERKDQIDKLWNGNQSELGREGERESQVNVGKETLWVTEKRREEDIHRCVKN